MEEVEIEENEQVINVLELFKQASLDIQSNPARSISDSAAINALLELQTESHTLLSDPCLSQLSHHLSYLKTLVETFQNTGDGGGGGGGLRSFLRRRLWIHQIARVAESIEWELQAWIDRELVESLVRADSSDDQLSTLLSRFEDRVSQGFNRDLQELLLKSRVFSELESILTNPAYSVSLREQAALTIDSLIRFNKNVFVGQVLMGPTTKALINMGSASSLKVLCSLIRSIKSPLVDEIEGEDQIGAIIRYMCSSHSHGTETQGVALECVMEIGYYGRKEAVEAMIKAQVVEKLLEMQRWDTKMMIKEGREEKGEEEEEYLEMHPFASCVARFAVQLEVGEGLRQREKRYFKQEILRRVREASHSDAEAATIQSQVLWGASFL